MRDREQQAADMLKEASKPFARTKDDVDEELNLRGKLIWHMNKFACMTQLGSFIQRQP